MLDPAANASPLGEIQRRGLRAAGELVDRLIDAVDGDRRAAPPAAEGSPTEGEAAHVDGVNRTPDGAYGSDPSASGSHGAAVRGSLPADLFQVWMDVFQRALQAMSAMARPDGRVAPGASIATADVGRGMASGAVHIAVAADRSGNASEGSDGRVASGGSAEVWLHNGTAEPVTGLRLHSGDLRAHDGSTLPGSAVRFDPPALEELPARSSRGVVVVADVADEVPGGVYRGVLLVAGAPDVWLPIVVTVADR